MEKDIIKIKIKCSSEECKKLREEGLFFQVIADALDIDRDDIEEIEEKNNTNNTGDK
ncbi:MAG: hypothetical protein QXQ79_02980 [Candidatus Nanoarchaeia archaeon]